MKAYADKKRSPVEFDVEQEIWLSSKHIPLRTTGSWYRAGLDLLGWWSAWGQLPIS